MIKHILNKYNIPISLLEIPTYTIPNQPQEQYYGNREYKTKIINLNSKKLEQRTTQCLFRIYEGNGKAEYFIGINDNGNIIGLNEEELNISIDNLLRIIKNANVEIYRIKIYNNLKQINEHNKQNVKTYCVFVKLRKTNIKF